MDNMKIILETDRLVLREFILNDAQSMYDLNTDLEVLKYTGDKPFESKLEARTFLENYSDYDTNGYGRWAVINKVSDDFIGWCGLKLNEESLVDIGFRFLQNEWNKGYATEAAKATLDYGFNTLKIDEIIGRVSKDNKPSIRVLEKLKMQFWKNDYCNGIKNAMYFRINKNKYNTTR